MKVCVCSQITYSYEVELPHDFTEDDLITCDSADPVYYDICKIMAREKLNFDGEIVSITDDDEVLYAL